MADFTSVLEVNGAQCRESVTKNGAHTSRFARTPLFLEGSTSPALRAYGAVTAVLRTLVRVLFLFPILVVVKIVLHLVGSDVVSDYVTVLFVVLVVALFATFALTLAFIAILGPRSQREAKRKLVFAMPKPRDASWMISATVPKPDVRVEGRVDAGLEEGGVVLDERWGDNAGRLLRFCEGASSFLVRPDEGEPVVVELEASPLLLAREDHADALVVPGVGAVTPLARFVIRQGDRVEVLAASSTTGTHPLLASTASAYRASESATVVTSGASSPIVIRAKSF